MVKIYVRSGTVYSNLHWTGFYNDVIEEIKQEILSNGWKNIPSIPIMEFPIEDLMKRYRDCPSLHPPQYLLLRDGNHRLAAAGELKLLIPAIKYDDGDIVDFSIHGCPSLSNIRVNKKEEVESLVRRLDDVAKFRKEH